jgi:small nuclear ribonucleoprotein (snRNP)-like protein
MVIVSSFLVLTSCVGKPVDVLTASDGTVVTGQLQSIVSGTAVISGAEVDVPSEGRVWCKNGSTFAGVIEASDGVIVSGSNSVPVESVYLVVWGDTGVHHETFAVNAAHGWLNTGIDMQEGVVFSLRSTGTVVTETGTATPQGQEKFSSSVSLVPGATSGQLVFRTGETQQPVAAGSTWVGKSPGSGVLMLAVNVPLEGSVESRGVYTVTVTAGTNGTGSGSVVFFPADRYNQKVDYLRLLV